MTKEEAIQILKQEFGDIDIKVFPEVLIALNIAIKALEQDPCEDAISRPAGRCVWCDSSYRIEYYWIDRDGNTASFQDENRHIIATGVAKYCPNCGAKMESEE